MTAPTPSKPNPQTPAPTPVRCFLGALIACPFAFGLYSLTMAIATSFAEKPIASSNEMAIKISVMVRTLVVGMGALGTGIFGLTTVGLVALGIQLLFKKEAPTDSEPTEG